MLTTRLIYTFVLASSLLAAPALAFGAVPVCADMDAPLFSMLMDELFSPGEYPTCASAAGVCSSSGIASACPVTCDACATDPNKPFGLDRQEPFDSAKPALVSDETMSVVELPGGHNLFVPATRVSDTHGVAYLPGGLVNHLAYAPLCREIARLSKLPVLLLRVTMRLAILGKSSITSALKTHATTAQVTSWMLGGHSMGGAAASSLADLPSVGAIFLHGAYAIASLKKLPVLQVLAEHDGVINAKEIEKAKALYMPTGAVVHVIAGGNHAGFGFYGPQSGDGERKISLAEQQLQVARTTADWLRTLVHAE